MTRKTHLTRSAGSAIAAALALTPLPLLAQDVIVPTITAAPPVTTPPAMPEPQPASAPVPDPVMVSSPVVQEAPAAPVVVEQPEAATPPTARSASAPVRETAPVRPVASPVAAEPVAAPSLETDDAVAPVAAAPVPLESVSATAPEAERLADRTPYGTLAALLAALGIAGLAGWGFVAIGRRRYGKAAIPVIERPFVARQPEPIVAQPFLAQPATGRVTPLASPRPAEALSHTGASVALPRTLPTSFAERDALLRRMIEAKPDRANPFRSRKARAHRARLIIQTLGRDFEGRPSWIDLSQYQANWPSLARSKSAAA